MSRSWRPLPEVVLAHLGGHDHDRGLQADRCAACRSELELNEAADLVSCEGCLAGSLFTHCRECDLHHGEIDCETALDFAAADARIWRYAQ